MFSIGFNAWNLELHLYYRNLKLRFILIFFIFDSMIPGIIWGRVWYMSPAATVVRWDVFPAIRGWWD